MDHVYLSIVVLISIPILWAIKNVIKRKTFSIKIFLRIFAIYFGIYMFLKIFNIYNFTPLIIFDAMLLSLCERRWSMFVYKIIYSHITKIMRKKN